MPPSAISLSRYSYTAGMVCILSQAGLLKVQQFPQKPAQLLSYLVVTQLLLYYPPNYYCVNYQHLSAHHESRILCSRPCWNCSWRFDRTPEPGQRQVFRWQLCKSGYWHSPGACVGSKSRGRLYKLQCCNNAFWSVSLFSCISLVFRPYYIVSIRY